MDKPGSMNMWRGPSWSSKVLKKGLKWCIGNGRTARFGTNSWLSNQPLIFVATWPLQEKEREMRVADYWIACRGWN